MVEKFSEKQAKKGNFKSQMEFQKLSNIPIDFLIIGGGIAGLSVVNRLVDLAETPVLIEASDYPSHKICGEFLSPESLPYLEDWGIIPENKIKKTTFFTENSIFDFTFPKEAASMSRYELDKKLCDRAKENGATIITNMKVVALTAVVNSPTTLYEAKLSDGTTLYARNVFVGGGRFFNVSLNSLKPKMPYLGFKAHFSGIDSEETLEMHAVENGYLGISPIEKNVVNVACLAKVTEKITNPEKFIEDFLNKKGAKLVNEKLKGGKMLFDKWLFTEAPEFEAKANPHLKNIYFIGDAAGGIAPATGNGLGMAITSGYMAADYAVSEDSLLFHKAWKKRYGPRIKRGQLLHQVMMNKILTKVSFFICKHAPFIPKIIFTSTRED